MIFRSISYWFNSLPEPPGGISPVLFYVPIFAIALFVLAALAYKPLLLSFLPKQLRFQTVDVERVPKLDRASLHQLTQEFQAAGFVHLADITNTAGIDAFNESASPAAGGAQGVANPPAAGSPSPLPPPKVNPDQYQSVPGFCRVFGHPQHGCLADLNQHYPAGGESTPFSWSIQSEMEQGWDLTTSSRRPEAIFYLLRRPRGARFTHSGARPGELLQAHLQERHKLQSDLGVGRGTSLRS
jgi:hypothetical protein